jgi:L,D-transpeptidase ErfK/SrfK
MDKEIDMARYRSLAERRLRNRIYVVIFVLVVGTVCVFGLKSLAGKKTTADLKDNNKSPATSLKTTTVSEVPKTNPATDALPPAPQIPVTQNPAAQEPIQQAQLNPLQQILPAQSVQQNPLQPAQPLQNDTQPAPQNPVPVTADQPPVQPAQQPLSTQTAAPQTPSAETTATPAISPNAEADNIIKQAQALLKEQPAKIIQARDMLNPVLRMPLNPEQRSTIKKQLTDLSDIWLFDRAVCRDDSLCETYQVKSGDVLENIGKRYKVPYEFLQTINSIPQPRSLKVGQNIKVVNGPFRVEVYRSTFTMDVYLQNTYVCSFTVTLGKTGSETPKGFWRVKSGGKLVKPTWTNPENGKVVRADDPEYPLGSRWIALEGLDDKTSGKTSYGIHGTKEDNLLGTAASHGCIRLQNGDVIKVYNMLVPVDSMVEVAD